MNIVEQVREVEEVDPEQARKYIASNRHNATTTIYYLLLKRHLRKGGQSSADIKKYDADECKRNAENGRAKLNLLKQAHPRSQSQAAGELPADNGKARGDAAARNSKNLQEVNTKTSKPDSRQKMVSSIKLKADIRLSDSTQN